MRATILTAKYIASAAKQKLRPGAKMMVNTKSFKVYPAFTIEIWHKPQRRYLPLRLPNGVWRWDKAKDRDAVLKQLTKGGAR